MFRLLCTISSPLFLLIAAQSALGADCRYEEGREDAHSAILFPRDDVFRAPLADPKEPRFYAGYQRANFRTGPVATSHRDAVLHSGFVAAGATLGLWSRRSSTSCDGVQVGLLGGVFSQFDLDRESGDLINSDFLVGVPVSARRGRWSGRARITHLSSHLGDEFLVRNRTVRVKNFGYETVDILLAYDFPRVRLYGGAGAVFNSSSDIAPGVLQAGVELRPEWVSGRSILGVVARPVAAVDFKSLEQQAWGATWSFVAGLELAKPGNGPRLRLVGTALSGYFPFAQFFDETRVDSIGMAAQFEL